MTICFIIVGVLLIAMAPAGTVVQCLPLTTGWR